MISFFLGKYKIIIILSAFLVAGFVFFGRDKNRDISDAGQGETFILNETVPVVDFGVVSSGFEEAISLTAINAEGSASSFEKISDAKSLLIGFSDQEKSAVKLNGYVDGVYGGYFYRLGFWAKSENARQVDLQLGGFGKNQNLGKMDIKGDGETRYFEVLFQSELDGQDLIISSGDAVAGKVWFDDFRIDELAVDSKDEMRNLKETISGTTTWRNMVGSAEASESSSPDSGDFFAYPNRKMGTILQMGTELVSGAHIKLQKVGTGGKGNYTLQIWEMDEDLGVPSDKLVIKTPIDLSQDPESVEKETKLRNEFAQKEKAIAEGRIIDNAPIIENVPMLDFKKNAEIQKQMREQELEELIGKIREESNGIEEIAVPFAAKVDPGKKYWVGISNENVAVDQENFIKIYSSGQGQAVFSEKTAVWKSKDQVPEIRILFPRRNIFEGVSIMSGAVISDLGNGVGKFRYRIKNSDARSFSGFHGNNILDAKDGIFSAIDNGNIVLSSSGEESEFVTYEFNTVYPVEKIYLKNISYYQNLFLEFSFDGENWEGIISETKEDLKTLNKIKYLILRGDGQSRKFYLRVSPENGDSLLNDLEVEVELRIE